jgi:hypothetical protein
MSNILSAEILEQADLQQYIESYKSFIDKALREHLPIALPHIETEFNRITENILFENRNKILSVLTMLGAEVCGGKAEEVLPASMAVEYVNFASNLFKNSSNKIENAVALALLNASYSLVFVNHVGSAERAISAHHELVEFIAANDFFDAETDFRKDLVRLALRLGSTLSGADYYQLNALERFAEYLGTLNGESNKLFNIQQDSEDFSTSRFQAKLIAEDAKKILVDNFPPCKSRTLLFQLVDSLV